MSTVATFTPPGLVFTTTPHLYLLDGLACISVTQALGDAGLTDRTMFTDADRVRGSRVHESIARYLVPDGLCECDDRDADDPIVGPYLRAFRLFLAESAFRVDACEEPLADKTLRVAGTLDLRGEFIDATRARAAVPRIDVVDIKTGSAPPWVGLQTAGYQRLLPADVRPRVRRWVLTLRASGTYGLVPLLNPRDGDVFAAAVIVAQFKRGWL